MKATTFLLVFGNTILQVYSSFFSSKPAPISKAIVGEDMTFSWKFTLGSGDELVLLKFEFTDSSSGSFETGSSRIAYRTKDGQTTVDKPFTSRVLVSPTGALTLFNVSVRDRGMYKCHIELKSGVLSHKVRLHVGVPPSISPFPHSNFSLLRGDPFMISCQVSGDPDPAVSWYWRRTAYVDEIRLKSLQITSAEPSHAGEYRCFASNYMGDDNRTLRLQVYERPKVKSFFNTASLDGTIYQCEEIQFTCEAFGNAEPPVKSFDFYHNGRLIVRRSKTGNFRIPEVQKKDEGRYCCIPENKYGFGLNSSLNLKVIAAPNNCKKTSVPPTDDITNVRTTFSTENIVRRMDNDEESDGEMWITQDKFSRNVASSTRQSPAPSVSTGLLGGRSSSQSERGCLVTALLWSVYSICNWLI